MIFLTYHAIADSEPKSEELFSVSVAALREHISRVHQRGFEPGNVGDLTSGRCGARSFFITFDDGTIDHFKIVAPILESHGLRGIFFVPTEKLGLPGRLERHQVKDLHDRGHEIGCHSHEHRRLDRMSADEIAEQLERSCNLLGEITGQRPRILAPPGGYTNGRVRAACANAGMRALRTMKWGLNKKANFFDLETIALHRDFPIARFEKIIDGRGLWRLRATYVGKQMLKSLLPIGLYEHARNFVFRK